MTSSLPPAWSPARSYLFTPGDRPERFDKAWASAADAVILDLEDAVPPDRKNEARRCLAQWLRADRPVWIRCNAVGTPWFDDDAALASHDGVAGVVLAKAEVVPPELAERLRPRRAGLIPLVETAEGLARAEALARVPEVVRLAFGALDFQIDVGIEGDDDALLFARSHLVLASRLASKLAPIDGITASIDDDDALRRDTARARRLGFGARLCIHPRQVAAIHETLAPTSEARAWGRRVVDAMRASNGAAVAVDGKMVDRPVLLRAQALVEAPEAHQRLRG